jgi:hypothetical protein
MKAFFLATAALALMGGTLSASALEKPDRKIVLTCSATHRPMMAEVVQAIEFSDYTASPSVRREILALARERCASQPSAVLTFVPPQGERDRTPDSELASK